jgi:hypothetical protein
MAQGVRILDERGDDPPPLDRQFLSVLRRIASGQIADEVISRFSDRSKLFAVIAQLPLPDQKRLGQGAAVPVAIFVEGHQSTFRMVDPLDLSPKQYERVFGGGRIHPPEEQLAKLDATPTQRKQASPLICRPDKANGGVVVGKAAVPASDLRFALQAISRIPLQPNDPDDKQSLSIPKELMAILKVAAAERQCSPWEVIWKACQAAGI